jgi:hypothetical protein
MSDYIGNRPAPTPLTPDQLASALPGAVAQLPTISFRNKLINGDFRVWQRGTSFSAISPQYIADRWLVQHAAAALTCAYTRQTTSSFGISAYYLRIARTAGTSVTVHQLSQRIEGARTFAGKKVTVSITAQDATAATVLNVGLRQVFGTGGSPTAAVNLTNQNITLSGTVTTYALTFDVPSVASATFGSNGDDYLELVINLPLAANFQVDLLKAQVEEGTVATTFEDRPIGLELSLCKRYFYNFLNGAAPRWVGVAGTTTAYSRLGGPHPVPMRAAPVVSMTGTALPLFDGSVTTNVATFGTTYCTAEAAEFDGTLSVAVTAGRPLIAFQNASGTMNLSMSAEL